jgi:isopenicillin-N N-acyltransferase like protein
MRIFEYQPDASPREWGRAHGEAFRQEVAELAAIRTYLTIKIGRFEREQQVEVAARAHLPVLEQYDGDRYQELLGIAEGADISPGQAVILNHYTDLRDLDPADFGDDDGCSALYARTGEGSILAQTWDMHATSIPYVMMLRVPARDDVPEAWVLSLTGCLGLAGLNAAGVGLTINNLPSLDAHVGVVWPALVRNVLARPTASAGHETVLNAPLGSGHHYLVADAGSAFAIEASGTRKKVIYRGEPPQYAHTNHCVDVEVGQGCWVPQASTSYPRYELLTRSLAQRPIAGARDAWERLGSREGYPNSICTNRATPQNPHGTATCATLVMNLDRRELHAHDGFCHNVEPDLYGFDQVRR